MLIKELIKKIIAEGRRILYRFRYSYVGKGTIIRKPLRVIGGNHIVIGDKTSILDGLRIEAIDAWNGSHFEPTINIGNSVNIGQHCHITCANRVIIGNGVSIMPQVLITDIEHIYEPDKSLTETDLDVGSVEIGDYRVMGMGARILGNKNVKIGKNVIVGTNSLVKDDIPDNSIAYGIPAKIYRR